jgi:hypothetical protein
LLEPSSYVGNSPQTNRDPSGVDWAGDALRGNDGALIYVPFPGTGLSPIATYNALRQCDFAKASEYMSGVLMGMIVGVYAGPLGFLLGDLLKAGKKSVARGEAAAEKKTGVLQQPSIRP